jgi:hypothetical protein
VSADIAAHYAAVRALIPSSATLYKGVVPDNPTYPYVVIWGDTGTEDSESLSDDPTTLTLKVYATVAGLTFDSAAAMVKITRTALNRKKPVVAGRSCGPLVQSPQMPIQADLTVSVTGYGHPFYAVDQYDLTSDPA